MCWSLALLCLQEAAQDKINEVAGEELKSSGGDVLARISEEPSDKDESESGKKRSQELADKKHEAFMKVLSSNDAWLPQVIEDAVSFTKSNTPRDKDFANKVLSGSLSPQKTPRENPVQTQLSIQFEEQVLPTLRSRGWKVDQKGASTRKTYSYSGQNYASIAAVLNAIPKKHPELMNMVNSLISSVRALCKEDDASSTPQLEFDPKNISADSLKELLTLYAPLQLLADRNRASRINLHHNTMVGRMAVLKSLHEAVKTAEKDLPAGATSEDCNKALSKLIKLDSKSSLPHPQWTRLQDAVLMRAVVKHGWLDRQASITAISNDKTIHWGKPFEAPAATQNGESEEKLEGNDASTAEFNKVLAVARRAISFMNQLKGDMVKEMTPATLNELQEKLITTYCLTQNEEVDGDEGASQWKVDEDHLKNLMLNEKATSEDCEDLPSKKKLSKRLKKLVSAFNNRSNDAMDEDVEEDVEPAALTSNLAAEDNYGFVRIDQAVRSNTLLAEMTRGLLKLKNKAVKQSLQEYAGLILSEVNSRIADMTGSGESDALISSMEKLKDHINMYHNCCKSEARPAKNVLR